MKVKKAYSVCAVLATALFAVYSYGEGPKAVLNAKQLGIQDLDIDLGLEEDIKADTEAAAVTAEAAPDSNAAFLRPRFSKLREFAQHGLSREGGYP